MKNFLRSIRGVFQGVVDIATALSVNNNNSYQHFVNSMREDQKKRWERFHESFGGAIKPPRNE